MEGSTLTVTQAEWQRAQQTGVLLVTMPGESERCTGCEVSARVHRHHDVSPRLLVEAAKLCDACDGNYQWMEPIPTPTGNREFPTTCVHCHHGKRRIEVRVPCERTGLSWVSTSVADVERCNVTVGTVVHQWGPDLIVERPSMSPDKPCVTMLPRGMAMRWPRDGRPEHEVPGDMILNAFPPGIDPASLVGQYASAFEVIK